MFSWQQIVSFKSFKIAIMCHWLVKLCNVEELKSRFSNWRPQYQRNWQKDEETVLEKM